MKKTSYQKSVKMVKSVFIILTVLLLFKSSAFTQCDADFTADQTSGCATLTVIFTDKSKGADNWEWYFQGGDPTYEQGKGPHKVKFHNAGSFNVGLQITCGKATNTEIKYKFINVDDCECTADFTAKPRSGTFPLDVTFTNNSINATSLVWTFPGGKPSIAQGEGPHQIRYEDPGKYDAILEIYCPSGSDIVQKSNFIKVFDIEFPYEFGDAPEDALAYKGQWIEFTSDDVIGEFTTCGPYGLVQHGNRGLRYFGDSVDHETAGNAGCCPCDEFDMDELVYDGDAGLMNGMVFQIKTHETGPGFSDLIYIDYAGGLNEYPMYTCQVGQWGRHLDIKYHVDTEEGAYVNVLVDWNYNGKWCEGGMIFHCMDASPPHLHEHILRDFYVPRGTGFLSDLDPPDFRIAAAPGYVWARFTISDTPVEQEDWTGHATFSDGETEDYLLYVADPESYSNHRDWGDAPEGNLAYPSLGVTGNFPTCGPIHTGTVNHGNDTGVFNMFFGCSLCQPSVEPSGNRGYCGILWNLDDDNGLDYLVPYTIEGPSGSETVVEEFFPLHWMNRSIGSICQLAEWGSNNLDMSWTNQTWDQWAYVNVLIDWNQDGQWGGTYDCGGRSGDADEHVLKNYQVPPASWGSGLGAHRYENPPDFRIGPNSGYVWARFTITPDPVSLPWDGSGSFDDGETEDYLFYVSNLSGYCDYGDTPWSSSYGTFHKDVGAIHWISPGFCLGDTVDADDDGDSSSGADGDDKDGIDDEDGVEFKSGLSPGKEATVEVTVTANGILNAWIDFDRDGSWADDDDQISEDDQMEKGKNLLTFIVPESAAPGTTYARFRFSDVGGLSFNGPHYSADPADQTEKPPIGEVEDYVVVIEDLGLEYDYGDAPDPDYATLHAHLGPYHAIDKTLYLGTKLDSDADGQPDSGSSGDDTDGIDDEDGVVFHSTLIPADSVKLSVTASDSGILNAWIDFNANGDWSDIGEQIFTDEVLVPGVNLFTIYVPYFSYPDSSYARFRFSSIGGLSYTGYAPDGEVEDYMVFIKETGIKDEQRSESVPHDFKLMQNFPNPFNPSTEIRFQLAKPERVRLVIYNLRGQELRILLDEQKTAGSYSIIWDGRDDDGILMPGGVYVYHIKAGGFVDTKKLLLLK